MTFQLYGNPASPFVRKVLVLLHETGQQAEVEVIHARGSALAPGTMPIGRNPLGKIPAMERPEGGTLFDSRVICRYLDTRAGGAFYPQGPGVWDTLTLEALADGIMDAAVLMVYETRLRRAEQVSPEILEAQWQKITRSLDALEARWQAHLAGRFDIGQIALGCALGYLDFRHGGRAWRAGRPGLARWYDAVAERPSMAATRPEQP